MRLVQSDTDISSRTLQTCSDLVWAESMFPIHRAELVWSGFLSWFVFHRHYLSNSKMDLGCCCYSSLIHQWSYIFEFLDSFNSCTIPLRYSVLRDAFINTFVLSRLIFKLNGWAIRAMQSCPCSTPVFTYFPHDGINHNIKEERWDIVSLSNSGQNRKLSTEALMT